MRQGCCLGCFVIVLLIAAACAGVYVLAARMGVFESFPTQQAASVLAAPPAVLVRADLQHPDARPFLESLIGDTAGAWTPLVLDSLPWDAAWALTPNRDAGTVDMVAALSLRRLAGLFESRAEAELWRWFPGQKVESMSAERPGIWTVRSKLPLRPEALAEAAARWSRPAEAALPEPGKACLSASLDNRDGGAYLALEPILNPPPQPGEKLRVKAPALDARGWAPYFQRLARANATLGFDKTGGLSVEMVLEANDQAGARDLLALLERARDEMAASIETAGGVLDGHWGVDDIRLEGKFTVRDGQRLLRTWVFRGLP